MAARACQAVKPNSNMKGDADYRWPYERHCPGRPRPVEGMARQGLGRHGPVSSSCHAVLAMG